MNSLVPLPSRLAILLPLIAGLMCPLAGEAALHPSLRQNNAPKIKTIFLVRHAEKAQTPGPNPPLSESGVRRTEALARLLSRSGVKVIYTSQYLRTRQTAEPLARQLGINVSTVPLSADPANPQRVSEQSLAELVGKVSESEENVLIIGHSNSVAETIRLLGGGDVPKIGEESFDDLFIVTILGTGKARVVHLKYGGAK